MIFIQTKISGLIEVITAPVADDRGRFSRIYCDEEFSPWLSGTHWAQTNISTTRHRGTIRGMHYQIAPAAETKLVRCLGGSVFDVAVDVREGSPTFLQWHAVTLSADNEHMLLIPPGCAHGFQALSDDAQLLYQHSAPWTPACERRLRYDDARIGIAWPLGVSHISDQDAQAMPLDASFSGVLT
ncbi:dTDP-4-dehydrorhamnose 3,5-epimerase family protein [Pinirhizobacter soli]|uniref:dTDP-4-dehydrorhamnose 3,5-epimerase family protein n=1 Tax=Pinirhizobacter soli TaxID=2786953 RepID=UPI00202A6F87|nr:dTDP-4-dehydrorhamnose 3,5-epimerase family protein [Pinirhizobacter soli]